MSVVNCDQCQNAPGCMCSNQFNELCSRVHFHIGRFITRGQQPRLKPRSLASMLLERHKICIWRVQVKFFIKLKWTLMKKFFFLFESEGSSLLVNFCLRRWGWISWDQWSRNNNCRSESMYSNGWREMFEFFRWLQRAYQKFHLSYVLPFVILISYTLLGAAIFRSLELERDLIERQLFRESYYYAFNQVLLFMHFFVKKMDWASILLIYLSVCPHACALQL